MTIADIDLSEFWVMRNGLNWIICRGQQVGVIVYRASDTLPVTNQKILATEAPVDVVEMLLKANSAQFGMAGFEMRDAG